MGIGRESLRCTAGAIQYTESEEHQTAVHVKVDSLNWVCASWERYVSSIVLSLETNAVLVNLPGTGGVGSTSCGPIVVVEVVLVETRITPANTGVRADLVFATTVSLGLVWIRMDQ